MAKNKTIIIAEPEKQEIDIIREFDAPRELVFKALTDPELYKQWLGPRNLTTKIDRFEARSGGSYRYIQTDESGNEYAFHGVYHEVRSPELIVDTFEYEGIPEPGHTALETLKLEELPGGRTKTVSHSIFQSVADRDAMIGADIERGINEGYDRLDELLEKMQKPAA